jgi:hypothetical protein
LQASLPARVRGLHLLLPSKGEGPRLVPGNALPSGLSWSELVGGPVAGIIPGIFLGSGEGQRDAAMAELPKMPVEELS